MFYEDKTCSSTSHVHTNPRWPWYDAVFCWMIWSSSCALYFITSHDTGITIFLFTQTEQFLVLVTRNDCAQAHWNTYWVRSSCLSTPPPQNPELSCYFAVIHFPCVDNQFKVGNKTLPDPIWTKLALCSTLFHKVNHSDSTMNKTLHALFSLLATPV